MLSLGTVELTIEDGVARVTLARPEAGNAIDVALAADLKAAVDACLDERVRVVLLMGGRAELLRRR